MRDEPDLRAIRPRQPARPPLLGGGARPSLPVARAARAVDPAPPSAPRRRTRALGGRRLAPRPPSVPRARRSRSSRSTPTPPRSPAWQRAVGRTRSCTARPASWRSLTRPSTSFSTGSCCTTSSSRDRSRPCSRRRRGFWLPAARWWRSSRGSGIRSAPGSRSPTAPVSESSPTAPPTTSRSRRATLCREARAAGLVPELHSVTYTWRRLPVAVQRAIGRRRQARLAPARGHARAHPDADREAGGRFDMTGKRPKLLVISGGVSSVTEAPERPATDETAPASAATRRCRCRARPRRWSWRPRWWRSRSPRAAEWIRTSRRRATPGPRSC